MFMVQNFAIASVYFHFCIIVSKQKTNKLLCGDFPWLCFAKKIAYVRNWHLYIIHFHMVADLIWDDVLHWSFTITRFNIQHMFNNRTSNYTVCQPRKLYRTIHTPQRVMFPTKSFYHLWNFLVHSLATTVNTVYSFCSSVVIACY